jgi:hypothetical protein
MAYITSRTAWECWGSEIRFFGDFLRIFSEARSVIRTPTGRKPWVDEHPDTDRSKMAQNHPDTNLRILGNFYLTFLGIIRGPVFSVFNKLFHTPHLGLRP